MNGSGSISNSNGSLTVGITGTVVVGHAPADHVVFDLDGTLVDSAAGILAALRRVLANRSVEARVPIDESLIGPPLRHVLQLASGMDDDRRLEELETEFREVYDAETHRDTVAYPGVNEALQRLTRRGASLHIATNKRGLPTDKILGLMGWDGLFQSVYCADSVRSGKTGKASTLAELVRAERIDASRAVFVGDSADDAEAASLVGMDFVAVTWGYGSRLLLERFPNVPRVSGPADLR